MELEALRARLGRLEPTHIADADKTIRSMDAGLRPVRAGGKLVGRACTVRCHDDFMAVIVALGRARAGDVLVVDTCGSRRAVVGELFSIEAARRGLAGLVVDGPVRDTVTLATLDIPVYARSRNPVAGTTRHLGEQEIPIQCGGVVVHPGDVLFGDDDGILVASAAEMERLLPVAEAIAARETDAIARMARGESLLEMVNAAEHEAELRAGRDSALKFLI